MKKSNMSKLIISEKMKKLLIVFFVITLGITFSKVAIASPDYTGYEEISLEKGKFLREYTEHELEKYYEIVDKRKFGGWSINCIQMGIKAHYRSETLFSYYNDGYTAIEYSFELTEKEKSKISITATGNIGIETKGSIKKFTGGLDSSLKMQGTYETNSEVEKTQKVKIYVDPGTRVQLYISGTGKLTNGVAAKYAFWIRTYRGGFEIFEVSTEFYRLEKVRIR